MTMMDTKYEVMVIGAGVAGVHAAYAAARKKARVLLMSSSWDMVALLGWGPRWHDRQDGKERALTGFPARAVERAIIYRGPICGNEAVLVDSFRYQGLWKHQLESMEKITIFQDTCEKIGAHEGGWTACTKWGARFEANALVLAVGTFLKAKTECGFSETPGGRPGETGDEILSDSIEALGVKLLEEKRTAGPVVSARSINHRRLNAESAGQNEGAPAKIFWMETADNKKVCLEPINCRCDQFYLQGWGQGELSKIEGLEDAEITKPAFRVLYTTVPTNSQGEALGVEQPATIYFAGSDTGSKSYAASAAEGLLAGAGAALNVSRET